MATSDLVAIIGGSDIVIGPDPGMKVRSGPNFGWEVRVRDDVWAGNCHIMHNCVMMLATGERSLGTTTASE